MKTIILAAGEGKRLRPLTSKKPKCLVKIKGESLLSHQIKILKSRKINDIILVGGYLAKMLKARGKKIYINNEYKTTNMVWSLFTAIEELNEEIIISYGDIVYSPKILDAIIKSKEDIAIAVDICWENYWRQRFDNPLNDAETIKIDSKGYIYEIGNKTSDISNIQGQYIGLVKLSKKGVKIFKDTFASKKHNLKGSYMTDFIQEIINDKHRVSAIRFTYPWIEVDNLKDLNSLENLNRISEIRRINLYEVLWEIAPYKLKIFLSVTKDIYSNGIEKQTPTRRPRLNRV